MTNYLTTQEVADHFRVSPSCVLLWIRNGRLPGAIDIGTSRKPVYRIPASSLACVVRNVDQSKMPEGVEKII